MGGFLLKNKDRCPLPPPHLFLLSPQVTYSMGGFLLKNKDRCPEDLLVLLRTSRTTLLRVAFAPTSTELAAMSNKRAARFSGIVSKFSSQLSELQSHLDASHVHFVRCIKPNAQLQPRHFVDAKVGAQLRCNAVVQACLIMKAGYPDRLPFADAHADFGRVARYARYTRAAHGGAGGSDGGGPLPPGRLEEGVADGGRGACELMMRALGVERSRWTLGNSRLCLKAGARPHAWRTTLPSVHC